MLLCSKDFAAVQVKHVSMVLVYIEIDLKLVEFNSSEADSRSGSTE